MKLIVVFAIFIICCYAAPLKNELLLRATDLDNKIKTEVKKLHDENREHMALVLQQEEKRLQTLTHDLKNVTDTDAVRTAVLESELITLEYRVENEIISLQRESATQELLESNAKILKQWVNEEIKHLESTVDHKLGAQLITGLITRLLRQEEQRLEAIALQLTKAQEQRRIETLEVELRAIEVRIYESLRKLHFNPSTATPAPVTSSTKSMTTSKGTAKPTRTPSTTISPLLLKNVLLKRAKEIDLNVRSEIEKLQRQNRTSLKLYLQTLDSEVIRISDRLQKTSQLEILQLLESELFWLESRLSIEIQALQAHNKRDEKLEAIAAALKQRITSLLKLLNNTPVGDALKGESKTLDNILLSLKRANDDQTIDEMEMQLTLIEKRVNDEVTPIVVPTVKPF